MNEQRHIRRLALVIALLFCLANGLAGIGTAGSARAEEGKLPEGSYADAYRAAYEKEYAGLDDYIYSFSANFDADEYRRRKTRNMTKPIQEVTTEAYNFVVDNYPEVAAYYASEVGSNFGGLGPIVSDAAYSVFTDSQAGDVFGELVAGALQFISEYDYASEQANKNPHPEYAEYTLVTGRYTLLKSSGTVTEILERHSGELDNINLKLLALEERKLVLQESHDRLMKAFQQAGERDGYLAETPEMEAARLSVETSKGMLKAVEDKYDVISRQKNQATAALMGRFTGPSSEISENSHLYNIIDNKTGEVLGAFCTVPDTDNFVRIVGAAFRINNAGMISVCPQDDNRPLTIMDRTGRVLHQSGGKYAYGSLTPCGNVLRVSRQTSVDYGDHLLVEVVNPDCDVVAVVGHAKPDTLYINEWQISFDENIENDPLDLAMRSHTIKRSASKVLSWLPFRDDVYVRFTEADGKEKKGLLDLSTLTVKKTAFDESMEQDVVPQLTEPMASKAGSSHIVNSTGFTQINKRYKLDNAKSIVYGPDGIEIHLEKIGSGVKAIHQDKGGRYWVVTKSGHYYVLNDDWTLRFKDPVQLGNDAKFVFTEEGLLVETAEGLTVYDMDGEILRTIEGVTMDSQRGDYVGSNKSGWFNVNTGEAMLVTMPESGISVLE